MRSAILLNSTHTYTHVGCYLTMSGLKATLRDAGIQVIHEIGVNETSINIAPAMFRENPEALIVINGEGTFHSDQPYALRILEAVRGVEARTMLLNSQFTKMSAVSIERIRGLAIVQVRNKTDQAALKDKGIEALFCPDMLFATGIEMLAFPKNHGGGQLFSDSHRPDVTDALWARYQAEQGKKAWVNFHYRPLGNHSRVDRLLATRPLKTQIARAVLGPRLGNRQGRYTLSETLCHFAAADSIITGRYHAACLAILFGKDLECQTSNTAKIERLLADVLGVPATQTSQNMHLSDYTAGRDVYFETTRDCLDILRHRLAQV